MKYIHIKLVVVTLSLSCFSCKKLLDVKLDPMKLGQDKVFNNDAGAIAAVSGIYYDMLESPLSGGGNGSLSVLSSLSADELISYSTTPEYRQFNGNAIRPENGSNLLVWGGIYKTIYEANAVLDGLADATGVSPALKKQLTGEAEFIRAFGYFYLVNVYGAVPLVLVSDYRQNLSPERSSPEMVYTQIIDDLRSAQENLSDNYLGSERIRPNKATATALLARVYLYLGNWTNAETQSTNIINDTRYILPAGLDAVFPASSTEAIWQLKPTQGGQNTKEAYGFVLTTNPANNSITSNALTDEFINSFEAGDERKNKWIGSFTEIDTWHFPFKYKVSAIGSPLSEYSIVFRLAEQYLIRSEARAQQDNIDGAKSDLDSTRIRAGIGATAANDKASLLIAIDKERRAELFTEWGHRWLDLKRRKLAETVLAPLKGAEWQGTDTLYPLPLLEMQRNPNLRPQNAGY